MAQHEMAIFVASRDSMRRSLPMRATLPQQI